MSVFVCGTTVVPPGVDDATLIAVDEIAGAVASAPGRPWLVLAADPRERRRLVAIVTAHGGPFATRIVPGPCIAVSIGVGLGSFLSTPVLISSVTTLGRHALVGPHVIIGHDCSIGDFVTIDASASIAGHVIIEDGVSIGAGAIVSNGVAGRPIRIGTGAMVAAGTVVARSVPAGACVAGNPGRLFGTPRTTSLET